ncbi:MAG: NCS1 family nucleobase:cation symporter-1 [Myxococcota bacterium]
MSHQGTVNVEGATASLINEDLAPTRPEARTWNQWHLAALWVGMAVCVPTYTIASSMIDQGMRWWQALLVVALGNFVVLLPMVLNGHPGTAYGIPFPILARASFGVLGANIPALLRALVACGWFGIQTWIGGQAIYSVVEAISPGALNMGQLGPAWLGLETGRFICFILFWVTNVYFIWKGTESIKWLETASAPFLLLSGIALLWWATSEAGGLGKVLSTPLSTKEASFGSLFWPNLTAMVGFWATLSLNIPDFTRFARSQRDQLMGQAMGLPTTMTLFAFIGIAVTNATVVLYGQAIWDPVALVVKFNSVTVVAVSLIALSIATLSTNIAANVVSPANDISNLAPEKISYKLGGYITAGIGIVILPWKLIESSQGYIFTWLIGYSALLGPIGGIMIADYFLLRRRELKVEDLYKRGGEYEYAGGFNVAAIVALVLAVLPNVPGFLAEAGIVAKETVPEFLRSLYTYAWFVGFLIGGGLHLVLHPVFNKKKG